MKLLNGSILHFSKRALLILIAGAAVAGCPNPADQFISGRLLDSCNGAYPVCTTWAGCFLSDGNAHYLEGKFPGTRRFLVRTAGQADITVAIFLTTEAAVGNTLRIEWNDQGCGLKSVESVKGEAFFKESEADGTFRRTKTVYGSGDHLIEVSFDGTAEYILKVETAGLLED